MDGQLSMFDYHYQVFKIDKPIRLIEAFAGIGSQAMALKELGAIFYHCRVIEFDKYAIKSYNAIHGTDFPTMDITKVIGEDLGIVDTDKYCYIMTYSFPCQDLSVAGKQAGMKKGTCTRRGLLWEVERLLAEVEHLPQVLIMENVPQVHGKKNQDDFGEWINFLESKGYSNYWQDLNAKNYGVAQNRNRCFMVSILGNYKYDFPKPIPLIRTMKDYLEDEVDEKYYINNEKAQELINTLIQNGTLKSNVVGNINPSGNGINGNVYGGDCSPTITTNKGEGAKICVDLSNNEPRVDKEVSNCITAREDRGISNHKAEGNGVIEWKVRSLGNIYKDNWGTGFPGNVWDKNMLSPTLSTMQGGYRQPMVIDEVKQLVFMDNGTGKHQSNTVYD